MANLHRGEIDAELDGEPRRLVLTLGALAELEAAFGDGDMLALVSRFERGRLSASDCMRIIGAGLRGAGAAVRDDDVATMRVDGGAAGYVEIVARLLTATFGGTGAAREADLGGCDADGGGAAARTPFPGPT
ncbi:MAG: gene transfer agent family protein [Hyphomonadaceae bacterium]|nr:gene transfer agent family protein [Hyphomicrobium sp.]MBX9746481.1 gene transfer agent family protein [Hyphomonadaceae bacterium]